MGLGPNGSMKTSFGHQKGLKMGSSILTRRGEAGSKPEKIFWTSICGNPKLLKIMGPKWKSVLRARRTQGPKSENQNSRISIHYSRKVRRVLISIADGLKNPKMPIWDQNHKGTKNLGFWGPKGVPHMDPCWPTGVLCRHRYDRAR